MPSTARSALAAVAAVVVAVAIMAGTALATSKMNSQFRSLYASVIPAGSALANARCLTCHQPKAGSTTSPDTTKLNPYGADLKARGMKKDAADADLVKALKAVERLDSDKDGVKNIDEIKKGTLPGDPKSK